MTEHASGPTATATTSTQPPQTSGTAEPEGRLDSSPGLDREKIILAVVAAAITIGAGIWGWRLSSSDFPSAPTHANPGSIIIAAQPGAPSTPANIELDYDAGASTTQTGLTLVVNGAPGAALTQSVPDYVVFLCGQLAKNPRYVDDRLAPVTWSRVSLPAGESVVSGGVDLSTCVMAQVPATQFQAQSLLSGTSGGPISTISGSKILYALPSVTVLPLRITFGALNVGPLPVGTTMHTQLLDVPADLGGVTAVPQMAGDTGIDWNTTFGPGPLLPYFTVAGELQNRQANGDQDLFIAGAMVGVAGGAFVWFIELAVTLLLHRGRTQGHTRR